MSTSIKMIDTGEYRSLGEKEAPIPRVIVGEGTLRNHYSLNIGCLGDCFIIIQWKRPRNYR